MKKRNENERLEETLRLYVRDILNEMSEDPDKKRGKYKSTAIGQAAETDPERSLERTAQKFGMPTATAKRKQDAGMLQMQATAKNIPAEDIDVMTLDAIKQIKDDWDAVRHRGDETDDLITQIINDLSFDNPNESFRALRALLGPILQDRLSVKTTGKLKQMGVPYKLGHLKRDED